MGLLQPGGATEPLDLLLGLLGPGALQSTGGASEVGAAGRGFGPLAGAAHSRFHAPCGGGGTGWAPRVDEHVLRVAMSTF